MRLDTQYYFKVIFKKIANEPGLTPVLNDLDFIPGTQTTFIYLSTTIFDMLRENHGSHLSVYELRESLNCDFEEARCLYKCINVKSNNISCEEFQNFLSKGSIDDINDLLSLTEVVENLGILQEDELIDEIEKNSVIIDDEIEKNSVIIDDEIEKNSVIIDDEIEEDSVIIDDEIEEDRNCIQYIINSVYGRFNSPELK